jgi:CheY-like chemotaxis protein
MLTGQTILIVEEEFLIALDIQRVLESLKARQTVFARTAGEALNLSDKWTDYGLALVEFRDGDQDSLELARGLRDTGCRLVLTTSDVTLRRGTTEMPDTPVIIKPFLEEELASAVEKALAR